ncbi:MFS general substrate transporter [Auriscalpium vulgare]|uniref:MFS general substrate transporter n=1 Tax=Auriscalpium vulgare TaxID=40419 RepID=A0ACB8S6G9_9AGAM|nr:MFS general substrate transporter [Auriscalpium vulgare]
MVDIDKIVHTERRDGPSALSEDAIEDSAVDDAHFALPSFLSAPSSRVRRRSELAFARPSKPSLEEQNAYELPSLSTHPGTTTVNEERKDVGVFAAPAPSSPAPSSRFSSGSILERAHTSVALTAKHRMWGKLHFAALCWCFFLEGWNDGSTGPLLPSIQHHYHLGFAVVSLIFVLNTIGFILGAAALVPLYDKLGFGWVRPNVSGAVCQMVTYAVQAPAGPFPLMVASYALAGFGMALQNAAANAFVGSLKTNTASLLGFLHGSYGTLSSTFGLLCACFLHESNVAGLGAFCAPLAATHFATQKHWSFHYLISLGLAVSNTALLSAVFRLRTQDEIMAEAGQEPQEVESGQGSKYRQILGIRAVHSLALFALIYVGVEVTLGGKSSPATRWIVTFVIRERQGGPSAGYISSGFFGGLTVGRVVLLWLNQKVGERRVLFFYAIISIGLEVTVWAVPSLVENAVAVSLIGLLMGPMYPILVNHATKVLPRWLLTGAIGLITGVGQTGSAVLPLVTGILASKFGISSLQPLVIAMMGVMTIVWAVTPKEQRRDD